MIGQREIGYIKGSITVEARGSSEKFLSQAVKDGLNIWAIKKTGSDTLVFNTTVRDFRRIRKRSISRGVKLSIISKRGLPFLLRRYRKRAGIITGTVIFFALLWLFSSFVWSIEISGLDSLKQEDILKALEDNGIKVGAFSPFINTNDVEYSVMSAFPELKWIQLEINGARVQVFLKEATEAPDITDKSEPCDIVAEKDAVILSIIAYEGTPIVRKGYVVQEGDLLVAGRLVPEYPHERFVHADAEIIAQTVESASVEIPLVYEEQVKTGRTYSRKTLRFFNQDIKLYFNDNAMDFENFYIEKAESHMKLNSNIYFPISVITETFHETEPVTKSISEEFALKEAEKSIKQLQSEKFDDIIITDTETRYEVRDNILYYETWFYCEEKIGVKVPVSHHVPEALPGSSS